MDEVRDRLRKAGELLTPLDRPFDRMLERRDRRVRSRRLTSATVALAIALGAVGGGVLLLSRLRQDQFDTAVDDGWRSSKELALQPGEYFYLRIESSEESDGWIRDEETWWGIDGSGEVRNRSTRQDKYPYPPTGTYAEGEFPIGIPNVRSLSTDPQILAAQLREEPWIGLNGPEPDRLWTFVGPLLLETPYATPELRAALFEVAKGIDGVTLTENESDPVGRPAIGLSFSEPEDGITWTTYFDTGTHQAIAWAYRSDRGGEGWQVLESAIVDVAGARPSEDQWLVPPLPS